MIFETLFITSTIIFVICFLVGITASIVYEDKVETLFKWYNTIVSVLTWSVFVMIPTGIVVLVQKLFS